MNANADRGGQPGESAEVIWTADSDGLRWRNADWLSASYLADLLCGEDPGRVTVEDVRALLALLPPTRSGRPTDG